MGNSNSKHWYVFKINNVNKINNIKIILLLPGVYLRAAPTFKGHLPTQTHYNIEYGNMGRREEHFNLRPPYFLNFYYSTVFQP